MHRASESFRRDSDDAERPAVDKHLRAEHSWIKILLLPVTVTNDRDRGVAAGSFLFWQKCAASRQRDSEDGEIVRADDCGERASRIAFLADTDQREIETHCVAENRVLVADVEISRIRKTAKFFRILLVLGKELHHFVWLGVSRWGKEKSVHQAEHCCVHANAECEHRDRRNRKTWRLK